ncbi:MAG: ATP-binding protein [Acidobacteria bacterium]|nr:ATP-binding protein [Acidobacteriota bacterium]
MPVSFRQNLLLLGAVILPSVLVITLGVYMIHQENELAEKRLEEQRQQAIGLAQQELLTRLEAVKLRAAGGNVTPMDADVVLVARVESGDLVLPWERNASRDQERLLRQLRNSAGATRLLQTSPDKADEYGVPFAVYAARRLAAESSPELQREILDRLATVLDTIWLSPATAHMIVEVAETLKATELRDAARGRALEAEQAEQLVVQAMSLDSGNSEPIWRLIGGIPWLVGITGQPADRGRTLVAVRAEQLLASVGLPEGGRWVLAGEQQGQAVGENFPGLRISMPPPQAEGHIGSRQIFYVSGLLLVISVTIFTAYLLHRDIRRETRLASLRAEFVSSVSHELRTPIAAIRAFAELLDMGRAKSEREREQYVRTILGESERLSRLVDGVLEFSKIDQGKRVYRLQPIALENVLRSAARALEYSLTSGNFELGIDVDPAVPPVAADREALEQAVVNLMSNAMKYSGEDRRIDLSLTLERDNAVIRIRDRGIGIPLEEQSRIFERFHRVPDSEQRNIPGTGLGLALVDHIVKAHGGRVAVESRPGQGSTFSILLPIPLTA